MKIIKIKICYDADWGIFELIYFSNNDKDYSETNSNSCPPDLNWKVWVLFSLESQKVIWKLHVELDSEIH